MEGHPTNVLPIQHIMGTRKTSIVFELCTFLGLCDMVVDLIELIHLILGTS